MVDPKSPKGGAWRVRGAPRGARRVRCRRARGRERSEWGWWQGVVDPKSPKGEVRRVRGAAIVTSEKKTVVAHPRFK